MMQLVSNFLLNTIYRYFKVNEKYIDDLDEKIKNYNNLVSEKQKLHERLIIIEKENEKTKKIE